MSSSAGLMMARAPGPSGSVTRSASPRTSAAGTCRALPLTRSAAEAISSATAATVTSRMLPNVSGSPRWSRTGATPAPFMPITPAAPSDKSMDRLRMKGPRSLIRTVTDCPFLRLVTRTLVPNGSVR